MTPLRTAIVALLSLIMSRPTWAASDTLEYPELLVVPKASETLAREAKDEDSRKMTSYLQYQVPALGTLLTGFFYSSARSTDGSPTAAQYDIAGIIVGGAWLAATGALMFTYHPYTSGMEEIKSPAGTKEQRIARERAAERAIESPAWLARRLNVLSVASNFVMSAIMAGASISLKDSTGATGIKFVTVSGLVSALAAWTPILFPSRWQGVACDQEEYKHRIYGPIAGPTLLPTSQGNAVPGMALAFRF